MVNVAPYISAYVGTPPNPSYRRCSRLLWRLGPTHLIEEPLSGSTADEMYRLGPNYVGSFQAPCPEGQVRVVSCIHRGLIIVLSRSLISLHASPAFDVHVDYLFLPYSVFSFTILYNVTLILKRILAKEQFYSKLQTGVCVKLFQSVI